MLIFKPTVRLKTYSSAIRLMLNTLDDLNNQKIPNYPVDWTITSINDSTHSVGSKHYTDQAIDLRSHNFDNQIIKKEFRDRLQFAFDGTKFTVLLEDLGTPNEHFHIQVKKGQVYP